ncbi:LysM peptidoglycan-binding domain-containing protein [Rhodococcus sp. D-6]|uniref:LysM peptidoglycan-binding domain-containing protein n=1 Tax=Rhodococcus sp. D-6 TaxID=1387842 RepID=A0AAU7V0N1_9NOCA|nr:MULTISPECIES: LysM peptidoglycan-binding domain-containing protein [Rhodococcus]USI92121.1 LysM peptidoglycan-binding domain-containing protein [Rhodococcus pyridinivorans]
MSRAVRIDTAVPVGTARQGAVVRTGASVRTSTAGRTVVGPPGAGAPGAAAYRIRPIATSTLHHRTRVPARTRPRVAAPSREPLHRRSEIAPRSRRPAKGTSWRQMATTVLLTALATTMLLVLAHVRTDEVISQSAGTTVVREGESLEALAARVWPEVPVDVTVARIADLNSLDGTAVQAGSRLLLPDSSRE